MKTIKYKGYDIKLKSRKSKAGRWSPWSEIPLEQDGRITFMMGKSFNTKKKADAYAEELAKDWIDHRTPK